MASPRHAAALAAMLVLLTLTLIPSTIAQGGEPVYHFPPPEAPAGWPLVEHVNESLNLTPGYVLGVNPISQATVEPVGNGDRVRIEVQNASGGVWRHVQPVTPLEGSVYRIAPANVTTGVEVGGEWFATIVAPPGVLPHEDGPADTSEALARRLGLPPVNASAWQWKLRSSWEVPLLHGVGEFYLHCECVRAVRHPANLSSSVNFMAVTMTLDGRPIAIELSRWVDLEESGVLSPAQAAAEANESLQARGYTVERVNLNPLSFRGEGTNATLVYPGGAMVAESGNSALIYVNAMTGDIESFRFIEYGPENPDGGSPDGGNQRDLPASGVVVAAMSIAAVAFFRRRRR